MAGVDLYNPTETHLSLRELVRQFGEAELDKQAEHYDSTESFNEPLFRRLGRDLNLFGLTVPEADGGSGLDPVATVIVGGLITSTACEFLIRPGLFYFFGPTESKPRSDD